MKSLTAALGAGLALASTLAAGGLAWARFLPAIDQVIASERAFAADGYARGVGPSFVTWAAPDGIILAPDPRNAREVYGKRKARPGEPPLKWWPARAGTARSGDLAFDVGPWESGKASGWFTTVWKRQPDGSWRWLLDHGVDGPASREGLDSPVVRLAPPQGGAGGEKAALSQVSAVEAQLNAGMAQGRLAQAYGARLDPDAWVAGLEPAPRSAPDAVAAAMRARPQTMTAEAMGGGASAAGDLAYTFGKAAWTQDGKPIEGRYVRVWMHRKAGWRLVMDEITPI